MAAGDRQELRVGDRKIADHHSGAHGKVAVDHREPEAVAERQVGDGSIFGRQLQVGSDRDCVAGQVGGRQPYELRRTGRPRGGQQKPEVGMQGMGGAPTPLLPTVGGSVRTQPTARIDHQIRVEAVDDVPPALRAVRVDDEHGVVSAQAGEIADDGLDRGPRGE